MNARAVSCHAHHNHQETVAENGPNDCQQIASATFKTVDGGIGHHTTPHIYEVPN
jgi:hypothetical protein